MATAASPVVILDRDGTVVLDRHYLDDPAQLEFLPGAAQGLRRFRELGHRVVMVSNQSGVGRGLLSQQRLQEINDRLIRMIHEAGARIEGVYCCPHRPEDSCTCRKPGTGLVLAAASELGFEPSRAVVIGDKSSDVELGRRLGAITMLVSQNGLPSDGGSADADFIVHDLLAAAALLERLAPAALLRGRTPSPA